MMEYYAAVKNEAIPYLLWIWKIFKLLLLSIFAIICIYFAIICKLMRETLILYIYVCKYLNNLCKDTQKTGMLASGEGMDRRQQN